jgi:AcrR family transcriptional regulator
METARPKRIRRDPETARAMILDATERVMVEDGYAAVSSRRIAQDLGLNAATIHYYYPATDDLFVALHARMTARQVAGLEAVAAADSPIEALWKFQSDWDQTALGVEFIALSNHRKSLRSVLAAVSDRAREAQARSLARIAKDIRIDPAILPPIALATILMAIARMLTNEERVGITRGHREVRTFVEWGLRKIINPDRD